MTNTDNHGLSTRIHIDSKPQIDFNLIKSIFERTQQFKFFSGLVLHGGSGLIDADFKKAIANGIKIIHLNTEFRKLWKESLMENLKEETVVPYKILNNVVNKLKEGIIYYQKLFLGI
jgi:fructose-bisphosphate aldolase class II